MLTPGRMSLHRLVYFLSAVANFPDHTTTPQSTQIARLLFLFFLDTVAAVRPESLASTNRGFISYPSGAELQGVSGRGNAQVVR